MHEQRLHRVAHARTLRLGVHDDPPGHVEGGIGMHIDVAQASGIQLITILFAALGTLQFAAFRQVRVQQPLQEPSCEGGD